MNWLKKEVTQLISLHKTKQKKNNKKKTNIITKSEKFFDAPKKITESVTEKKSKEQPDLSISN